LAIAASICIVDSSPAWATEPIHPRIVETTNDIASARGPSRYAALRELWSLWDDTDPLHVEEALRHAQRSPTLDASSRAYSALLGAYARRRRGDLHSAKAEIASLGFVDQWMVVGPFDNEGRTGYDRVFDPEVNLSNALDPQEPHQGKERTVRWRSVPPVFPFGSLDFGDLLRPEQRICAYASTFVRSTTGKARTATVWLGTTGAFRAFWNGEEVLSDGFYRVLDAERFATTLDVKAGWNRLTVKVCGDAYAPALTLRLGDRNGAPDRSIEVSADSEHAVAAARNSVRGVPPTQGRVAVRARGDMASIRAANAPPVRARDPGQVRGPVDQFEAMVRGPGATPAALEAYARYLTTTGGDDPARHVARDFATRAAEKAPTVERLLLAATLAEDRNQQRVFVDKAAAMAPKEPPATLLHAQAHLARTGPHWRDAIPFYDQLLARDPDDVDALLGRIDLYNEAGLQRTALEMLERAIERNPRAVGLLRIHALQLAGLGRYAEAQETSTRYSSFRFDDATQVMERITVAVAQRNDTLAEHWVERLLAIDPASSPYLRVAAHTYTAMGNTTKLWRRFSVRSFLRLRIPTTCAPSLITTVCAVRGTSSCGC